LFMEINAVAVFGVVLHTRAGATPEGAVGVAVILARTRPERDVIASHSVGRILRSQNVVVEGALVVIRISWFGVPLEEVARQLEHVVGVASLCRVRPERLGERFFGGEMFAVTMPADDVRSLVDDRVPEEQGSGFERFLAGEFILARRSDEFGDLGVGMEAGELVLSQ